jgi:hypothetical protein
MAGCLALCADSHCALLTQFVGRLAMLGISTASASVAWIKPKLRLGLYSFPVGVISCKSALPATSNFSLGSLPACSHRRDHHRQGRPRAAGCAQHRILMLTQACSVITPMLISMQSQRQVRLLPLLPVALCPHVRDARRTAPPQAWRRTCRSRMWAASSWRSSPSTWRRR